MRIFVVFFILLSFVIPVVASDMLPMAPTRYDDKDELPYGDFTSISGVDPKIPDQDPKKPVVSKPTVNKSVAGKQAPTKQTRAPAKTVQKPASQKKATSATPSKKRAPSAQKKKLPQKLPPKKAK